MWEAESWSLGVAITVLAAAAGTITLVGVRLTAIGEQLARRTGMGQAVFGALFLGAATSISGLATSITAAATNHPELALGNALGGIAVQTAFLAVADMTFRGANLEHAAASVSNLMQGALCSTLLAIVLFAMTFPSMALAGIHPASLALFVFYVFGMRMVSKARDEPMWSPRRTPETRTEDEEHRQDNLERNSPSLWISFIAAAAVVAVAGYFIARAGVAISLQAGVSETVVGSLFTAVSTSLPELVTSVAAVRQGALTLAVGGIIGGNCFDVLFVTFSDAAYRGGSIYTAVNDEQRGLVVLGILLTNILLLGLLRRQKHGVAGIGFESFLVLVTYLGFVFLFLT